MKMIMVTTKKAATSMIQPSKMSWFHWVRESRMAMPMLPTNAAIKRGENRFAQIGPANFGQIGQGDADDEGGFDPFAQSYDECLQHLVENFIIATRLQLRTQLPPPLRIVSPWCRRQRSSGLADPVRVCAFFATFAVHDLRFARSKALTAKSAKTPQRSQRNRRTNADAAGHNWLYRCFRNCLASSSWGKSFSSAWNSAECTHRRLPRSLTGCLRWSIS